MQEDNFQKHSLRYWAIFALVVFAVVSFVSDRNKGIDSTKTITVRGEGIAYAIQDTAELSFSVTKKAADVKTAQNEVNDTVSNILKAVKDLGVEDKNIKTIAYNVYPHYKQVSRPCPLGSYCPIQSETDGFEASQTVEIKMRDLSKSGDLVTAIGEFNPTNISGLQFVVEDDKAVLKEARKKAIADARAKAKELAKDLGVRLGKVVSFDENGAYPIPIYMKTEAAGGMGGDIPASIPTGQNKVTSNVTIVYEIR
ncbi:MAG TPA: SIMPL domain-containing protein [Candidatus Paceibacterota bacterium]